MSKSANTRMIKDEALRLGFDFCGVSRATFLEEEAPLLEKWLRNGFHGRMQYMENHFDKRLDPRLLVEGTRSVVSLMLNYFPEEELDGSLKISKYAYGKDYHLVLKEKCHALVSFIREQIGEVQGRAFVDSAPVLDKAWASRSGLGWIGKNANLINKKAGSYFFIAELLIDLELDYDSPVSDHCGTCTRCIDACPTDAIVQANVIDGSRCISYLTIELKENIPQEFKGETENWIFGCDVCQDVCPWNRFSKPHRHDAFKPSAALTSLSKRDFREITEEVFRQVFGASAITRTGFEGLQRNIRFAEEQKKSPGNETGGS